MTTKETKLKDKIIMSLIVIIVGIHILNWNMEGIGWKGNVTSKIKQILLLPWSLI